MELDPGNLSPGEKRLLDIVEKGLESDPPDIPSTFRVANGSGAIPPSVGVPVEGNKVRQETISRLVGAGLLHYYHQIENGNMVFLSTRPIRGRKPEPLPWQSMEEKEAMAKEAAVKAAKVAPPKAEKVKVPKPPKVEAPLVPCACGCGGMAKKAFVMHHDGKLAATLHLLIAGKGDASHKQIVKNAFANPHVANSDHFKKLYAKWQAAAAAK